MHPTQIVMAWYVLGKASKEFLGSVLYMPKEGSDDIEDVPGRVHTRYGVWCK